MIGDELAPLSVPSDFERKEGSVLALPPEALKALCEEARQGRRRIPVSEARLLPPVAAPSKIFAIGLNYADHIAESGLERPEVPTVFAKFPSCLTGPHDPVERPRVSRFLDYEGELAFVIGGYARHVPAEKADDVIAGYMVLNDFSVRDWQMKSPQWSMAKSFDTHGPIGPWITDRDEVDPSALAIETKVNGEVRQRSNTRELVFDCRELVAFLSQACTLRPGDIVATGTPAGVGALMEPARYLEPGDEVEVTVEGLGSLHNTIVEEPPVAVTGETEG